MVESREVVLSAEMMFGLWKLVDERDGNQEREGCAAYSKYLFWLLLQYFCSSEALWSIRC